MRFFDVMYYYYYVFYSSIYKENDPGFTAKLAISASESFLMIAIFSIGYAYFFCDKPGRAEFIIITLIIIGINFFVLLKPKREQDIFEKKPMLFNSNTASVIIAWLFFLFTTSILFWLNNVVNFFAENCVKRY